MDSSLTPPPILSILTPAVPSRIFAINVLQKALADQIGTRPVEHLVLVDNKRRTVGEKRDALLRAARGTYVAFVDDDDMVAPNYVAELLKASTQQPDVITFCQQARVNGEPATVEFKLGNGNEPFKPDVVVKRNAWHVCAWVRTLVIQSHFPAVNYGEDWAFAEPLCKLAKKEVHIPQVLHYYRHSTEHSEAPPPERIL